MSELGLLSYQYQALAELSRQLRNYIVYAKRIHYDLPIDPNDELNSTIVSTYFNKIVQFLSEVIDLENESSWPEDWIDDPPLPNAVVERLRLQHEFDRLFYTKQLQRLAERLESDLTLVTPKDIKLLEEIAQATNMDTTSVFRRLMRWA